MFSLKKTEVEPRAIELALAELVKELQNHDGNTKEYTALVANVKTLTEANAVDQTTYKPNTVSAETWATIGANIGGILLIMNYERAHVLVTKALNSVVKLKI